MEEDEIIAKDRANHPDCNYSISFNETCYDKNGEFVCDSIKNFQRICPGKKPVTVYSQKQQFKGSPEQHSGGDDPMKFFNFQFPRTPGGGADKLMDPFSMAESIFGHFMQDFGGMRQPRFPTEVPPHRAEQGHPPSFGYWGNQQPPKPKIPGHVVGSEEEI